MSWHLGPIAALDLETTGLDPLRARIVTAAIIVVRAQRGTIAADDESRWVTMDRSNWVVGDVEIPAEAAAIHGITTERAAAVGRPGQRVVGEIARRYPQLAELPLPELHKRQRVWARAQAGQRAARYEAEGRVERVNGQWPMIPRPRNGGPK